jgi:hypothetical protein
MVLGTSDEPPSIERVAEEMARFRLASPVTDEEYAAVEHFVHAQLILSMGEPVVIATKFEKWLLHRKAGIRPYYWERYRHYMLQQGWGPAIVRQTDKTVDDLLDYCGDPEWDGPWKRRGLVVGNVQSGKTATYTALCNKAADAGYRVIILLAGTLNSLRHQTQGRLDEGFVGFDTAVVGSGNRIQKGVADIGVGKFANRRAPHAYTSKARDFDANLLGVRTRLDGLSEPVLMVVKKNKKVLDNLYAWLADFNPSEDGKIHVPLLLIDDEADAASVNTGSAENPRAINAGIRRLLSLFSKSSYVGFTATPFANIFIAPDSAHDMLEDDLFPRDYIYSLEPPSNYLGPVKMFREQEELFIRIFDDAEEIFPQRHKKYLEVNHLPPSLLESMASFLIVNALRDLRGQVNTHRSMLVNVSWANDVQLQVAELLKIELGEVLRDIETYGAYSPEHALARSVRLQSLKRVFDGEYCNAGFLWADVQAALLDATRAVLVQAVNMSSGTSRLDYEAHKSQGLRVIAVGGNALSRGLTLEGLSTSYIYRNSRAYDTLLQMGRWFGYRPGFEDLCRVWMSEEALSWYAHITEATEELRAEFRLMHDLGLTPQYFGLRVRAHPEALVVTARAKMRTAAEVVEGSVSLSTQRAEATQLLLSDEAQRSNISAAERFLESIASAGVVKAAPDPRSRRHVWHRVPKLLVAQFLAALQVSPTTFQPQQIARFLKETDLQVLNEWDVAILSGTSERNVDIAGLEITPVVRQMLNRSSILEVFKRRLFSADDEAIGLDIADAEKARAQYRSYKEEGITGGPSLGQCYRRLRKRPLLLLYFIDPTTTTGEPWSGEPQTRPIVSVGLSFPQYNDSEGRGLIAYQTNQVWQQMRLDLENDTDEDELIESATVA